MADPQKHEPKPDVMASRAPAQVTRTVIESKNGPTPGIEVGLPSYLEDHSGLILNHRLYITDDPSKEYRFCTKRDSFGAQIRKNKGFVAVKDKSGAEVVVGGMQLCERPAAYREAHDQRIRQRTLEQSRKHNAKTVKTEAAEKLGLDSSIVTGQERTEVEQL